MDAKRLDLEEKELELEAKKAGVKLSLDAENAKSKIALDTAQMIKDIDRE